MKDIHNKLRNFVENSPATYLSTVDKEGCPDTRAVCNLRNGSLYPSLIDFFKKDDYPLSNLISTHTTSTKVQSIKRNKQVSVYYCLPEKWQGLYCKTEIEIVEDLELKNIAYQKGWEIYYPKGVEDPTYALLYVKPITIKYYENMKTYEMNIEELR